MNKLPNWLNGFIRVFVVLFILFWLGFSVWEWQYDAQSYFNLIVDDFNPYFNDLSSPKNYCAKMATADYINMTITQREEVALASYNENADPAKSLCVDLNKLKSFYLSTAKLSLEEAPIEIYSPRLPFDKPFKYRKVPLENLPGVNPLKIFFDWSVFYYSFVASLISIIPLIIAFLIVRWVIQGFKGK